jgi:hypothetical protein
MAWLLSCEAFEDEPYRHRAFPDCGRGPLDRPAADIADGEDPGPAGFQCVRAAEIAVYGHHLVRLPWSEGHHGWMPFSPKKWSPWPVM